MAPTILARNEKDSVAPVEGDGRTQIEGDGRTQIEGDGRTQIEGDGRTQIEGDDEFSYLPDEFSYLPEDERVPEIRKWKERSESEGDFFDPGVLNEIPSDDGR
ncbi:MAG: hypothetical protein AABP62_18830 [Planctomycetota bacterium]